MSMDNHYSRLVVRLLGVLSTKMQPQPRKPILRVIIGARAAFLGAQRQRRCRRRLLIRMHELRMLSVALQRTIRCCISVVLMRMDALHCRRLMTVRPSASRQIGTVSFRVGAEKHHRRCRRIRRRQRLRRLLLLLDHRLGAQTIGRLLQLAAQLLQTLRFHLIDAPVLDVLRLGHRPVIRRHNAIVVLRLAHDRRLAAVRGHR